MCGVPLKEEYPSVAALPCLCLDGTGRVQGGLAVDSLLVRDRTLNRRMWKAVHALILFPFEIAFEAVLKHDWDLSSIHALDI